MAAFRCFLLIFSLLSVGSLRVSATGNVPEAAMFIILGQSNADGSAYSDVDIDRNMWQWYTSSPGADKLHIWYSPGIVRNETDSFGRRSPTVYRPARQDAPSGWMHLWYRNNNTGRQTAMNMIHGAGTASDLAQMRRGIEGEFGRRWTAAYPGTELYVLKLGVSGSRIDSWTDGPDGNNRRFFLDSIYRPAVESLVREGKMPYLAGVWWMQGEADSASPAAEYEKSLRKVADMIASLGFGRAPIYIGMIPENSKGYGGGVRQAQMAVAAELPEAELINTEGCPMQYEEAFGGYIHFDHAGVNCLADKLMDAIEARTPRAWVPLRFSGSCSSPEKEEKAGADVENSQKN